jgi:hypothetical protein
MPRFKLTTLAPKLSGVLCALVFASGQGRSARAAAASDSSGVLVAPGYYGVESFASAIPDSLGGAFVAFYGTGSAPFNFREAVVARLGPDGSPVPGWSSAPVSGLYRFGGSFPGDEIREAVAPAHPDAVWMVADWADVGQKYYLLVGANGPSQPETSGVATRLQGQSVAVPLGNGRTLIQGGILSNTASLIVSVLDPTGVLDSSIPDIPLTGSGGPQNLVAIPDGTGGAISVLGAFNTAGNTGADLMALRLSRGGAPMWSPAERVVTAAGRDQSEPRLCTDGTGGAYFVWTDKRNITLSSDVYALHLLPDGSIPPGWHTSGEPVASMAGDQFQPRIAEDGRGGCWIVWTDSRSGENDIYYTRLGPGGTPAPGFPAGGRSLCAAAGGQITPQIVADGTGGFFAAWIDDRAGELNLYGQHIHSTGVVMPGWTPDGVALCTNPFPQSDPMLVLSAPNRALAIWSDTRAVNPEYYAMVLPADGEIAGVSGTHVPGLEISRLGSGRDLEFTLLAPGTGAVRISLFDIAGRRIEEQLLGRGSGRQQVRYATDGLRPGLYLARARQDGEIAVSRSFLIR